MFATLTSPRSNSTKSNGYRTSASALSMVCESSTMCQNFEQSWNGSLSVFGVTLIFFASSIIFFSFQPLPPTWRNALNFHNCQSLAHYVLNIPSSWRRQNTHTRRNTTTNHLLWKLFFCGTHYLSTLEKHKRRICLKIWYLNIICHYRKSVSIIVYIYCIYVYIYI